MNENKLVAVERSWHPNGVLAYAKMEDGTEYWYDGCCELIRRRLANGLEEMYANGGCIYKKHVDGIEITQTWYDSNRNPIRRIDIYGREWRFEYDRNGKLVRETRDDTYEAKYKNGKCILRREKGNDRWWVSDYRPWLVRMIRNALHIKD